jgi:hypothetical protein
MGIKCHAIRDAQIAEKKQIGKELEEEEHRLDQMMEDDRRRALRVRYNGCYSLHSHYNFYTLFWWSAYFSTTIQYVMRHHVSKVSTESARRLPKTGVFNLF